MTGSRLLRDIRSSSSSQQRQGGGPTLFLSLTSSSRIERLSTLRKTLPTSTASTPATARQAPPQQIPTLQNSFQRARQAVGLASSASRPSQPHHRLLRLLSGFVPDIPSGSSIRPSRPGSACSLRIFLAWKFRSFSTLWGAFEKRVCILISTPLALTADYFIANYRSTIG